MSVAAKAEEYIWGRNAVREALRAGRPIAEIWVARGVQPALFHEIWDAAEARGVAVQTVDRGRLDAITDRHQGVVARVETFGYADLEAILDRARAAGEPPLILIVDGLQDPQNLGTLLRTLAALGGHGVVIGRHRAVGVTPGVVKASAGAVQHLAVARVANVHRAIETLRQAGVWVAGLDAAGPARLPDLPATDGLAIVIGNEGEGLSRLTRERCDWLIGLPTSNRIDSLNAAVAGSIALYDVWRRRHPDPR